MRNQPKQWFYGKFLFIDAQRPELKLLDFVNNHKILPKDIKILSHGTLNDFNEEDQPAFIRFMYFSDRKFNTDIEKK